ncbi:endonuclease domain-containing protein [Mycobacterium sp.]|uniref:endonuclease domain-containing protein n=1 Tax=Mycobacterium sp. TaxID=1785 RepID=UPI00344B5825
MADPLAAFPVRRQVMVIKTLLIGECCDRSDTTAPTKWLYYRSPSEVRSAIGELQQKSCLWFRGIGWDVPATAPSKPLRQSIFQRLVAAFGSSCASCGVPGGHVIDHDHLTGAVRGLLCRVCNANVDRCVHVSSEECRYARYLNDPPAATLGLKYYAGHRWRPSDDARSRILGFNLLDQRSWPSPHPTQWEWDVPPPERLSPIAEKRLREGTSRNETIMVRQRDKRSVT